VEPAGAYYIITDVSRLMPRLGASNDTEFSRALIEKGRVATVPGSSFYSNSVDGKNQVRFWFCKRWETLHAVAETLGRLQ
jgi:aminotransferase